MNRFLTTTIFVVAATVLADNCAAAPAGAIPVYCTTGVGVGFESVFSCRRADTRAVLAVVPDGMFLHVTEVIMNPNNIATTGTLSALIGRDDSSMFPATPSLDLLGFPTQSLSFSTPYIVLRGGEALSVFANPTSTSPIDVRVSAYLASEAAP